MTPVALFLVCDPITDHNGACSKSHIGYFEKVVKNTHRVFIEVVRGDKTPEQYLAKTREKAGQKISLFFQFGHGGVDSGIGLSRHKNYRALDIQPEVYQTHMAADGCIYYMGCRLSELARKTAKVTGMRAFGPLGPSGGEILVRLNGKYQIMGCDKDYSFFNEFDSQGDVLPPPLSANETLSQIYELALLGDSNAQGAIANLGDTNEDRIRLHRTAAENGHFESRRLLLLSYAATLEPSLREKWFLEILEDFVGCGGVSSADQFAAQGDVDFAERIYRKIYGSDRRLRPHLAAARGLGQICQCKGHIREALQFYLKAAGKETSVDSLPSDDQIGGKELVAMYQKLKILKQVVQWTKTSASLLGDCFARKWLDEIHEARDLFTATDLDAAELLATFYEWGEEESDRPKAEEMYKLMASW